MASSRYPISIVLAASLLLSCSSKSPDLPQLSNAPYRPDSGNLLVHCGKLIDGRSDQVFEDVHVLIENGRFRKIGRNLDVSVDTPVFDLSGYTCLPGLIEMHTHILESFEELVDLTLYYDYSLDYNLEQGREYSSKTIDAGFTSARNLAVYYGWADAELRDQINSGEVVGPRLQAAGFYLTVPGGGGDLLEPGGREADIPGHLRMGVSRSTEEFGLHARAAVDGGADVLKVIASGAVLAYGGVPGEPEMTLQDIAAVVEVAHAAGLKVAAHAHGAQSIRDAILAGADTIEHATYIDDEGIQLAIQHDVALTMDIGAGDWMIKEGREQGWVEEFIRKTIETTRVQRESFKKAHEAGATIVFGTDAGIYPHGMHAIQFPYMVEWGMTPMEAIKSATSIAAIHMGWADRVGAIEPGLFGDLIAVKGDPLQDISVLERVEAVVKGGLVFKAPEGTTR
jgi:imidazolonepropionase-like amidohydrolase